MAVFLQGEEWISTLESLHLIHPSITGRRLDIWYFAKLSLIMGSLSISTILSIIGSFFPNLGLSLGNFLNIHGVEGEVMCFAGALFCGLIVFCQIRLLTEREAPFLKEILAYHHLNVTILSGKYKTRWEKFYQKSLYVVKLVAVVSTINMFYTVVIVGFVIPLTKQGVSVSNVLFWAVSATFWSVSLHYLSTQWAHIFGLWFVCKSHLDMQAKVVRDIIDLLLHSKQMVTDINILYLNFRYVRLCNRVRTFDRLSRDLISPYRQIVTYVCVLIVFGCCMQGNIFFAIGIESLMANLYVTSLVLVYTACLLSIQRRRMYVLINSLFVKCSTQRISIFQLIVLRKMIKSLGNNRRPTISLTDKSGREFEPMEFVKFILETFAIFTLSSTLYRNYVS